MAGSRAIDVTGADLAALEGRRKEMGADLRMRRTSARMTQAELGGKVGVSRSTVSNAETGARDFSRGLWAGFDRAFGLGTHFIDWHRRVYAGMESYTPRKPDPAEVVVSAITRDVLSYIGRKNPRLLGEAVAHALKAVKD